MSHTKTALAALLAIAAVASDDGGPDWWRFLKALAHITALVYLGWYLWWGPDVVEKQSRSCLVCGEHVNLRGYGSSWHSGNWGAQRHEPGPALIDPCEFHGWRELTKALDAHGRTVAACLCKTTTPRRDPA